MYLYDRNLCVNDHVVLNILRHIRTPHAASEFRQVGCQRDMRRGEHEGGRDRLPGAHSIVHAPLFFLLKGRLVRWIYETAYMYTCFCNIIIHAENLVRETIV